ncbi:hypothetical protein HK096_002984, partial [Nowakowskiella sp. JEL0078]
SYSQIDPIGDYEAVSEISVPITSQVERKTSSALDSVGSERTLLGNTPEFVTWEYYILQIKTLIAELTSSEPKAKYISTTNQILNLIRSMLSRCGSLSRDSPVIKKNKILRSHHQSVISSLSKLVLSAKVASGIWPPPDALQKMRYQANQVLSSTNLFMNTAKDLNIELRDIVIEKEAIEEFDEKGAEMSDIETVARLDSYSESIIVSIGKLMAILSTTSTINKPMMDQIRITVSEVGQLMSLIEDLKVYRFNGSKDLKKNEQSSVSEPTIEEFRMKKEHTYTNVNNLVTSARVCMDEFAPPNAFESLQSAAKSVLDTIEDLMVSTKLVIDQNDYAEQLTLMDEAEFYSSVIEASRAATSAKLHALQRRAQSLNYEGSVPQTPATTISFENEFGGDSFAPKSNRSMSIGSGSQNIPAGSPQHAHILNQQIFIPSQSDLDSPPPRRQSAQYALQPSSSLQQQHALSISTQFQPIPHQSYPQSAVSHVSGVSGASGASGSYLYPSTPPQPPPSLPPPPPPNPQTQLHIQNQQMRQLQQQQMSRANTVMSSNSPGYSSSPQNNMQHFSPQAQQFSPGVQQFSPSITQFSPNNMQQLQMHMQQMQIQQNQIQQQQMYRGISLHSNTSGASATSGGSGGYEGDMMRTQSQSKEWLMSYDHNREDVSFNSEGLINGGTFPALVERLTMHDQPADAAFLDVFLMMFHVFSSSQDLLTSLLNRFFMVPLKITNDEFKAWTEKKQKPIRIRVYRVLVAWLDTYWIDAYDEPILDELLKFATGKFSEFMPVYSATLIDCINKKIAAVNNPDIKVKELMSIQDMRLKQVVQKHRQLAAQSAVQILAPAQQLFSNSQSSYRNENPGYFDCYPVPILPKSMKRIHLTDLDPAEVARQLSLMEMKRYCAIGVVELIGQEWNKAQSLAVNVKAMGQMQTKLGGWVAETILQEIDNKSRINTLKHFIKIADKCLALNNFNTLISIQSALGSSAISRLKKTWDNLGAKSRNTYDAIRNIIGDSRNYADYKNYIRTADVPCLPCLSFSLVDLSFAEDSNPSTRNGGRLINFEKYSKLTKTIKEIQRFQVPYPLTDVPVIQKWLGDSIENSCKRGMQELFKMSVELEREEHKQAEAMQRDMDSKFKMLEKAGFHNLTEEKRIMSRRTLFVSNIPPNIRAKELAWEFERYRYTFVFSVSSLIACARAHSPSSQIRRFGEYWDARDADDAYRYMHDQIIDGYCLHIQVLSILKTELQLNIYFKKWARNPLIPGGLRSRSPRRRRSISPPRRRYDRWSPERYSRESARDHGGRRNDSPSPSHDRRARSPTPQNDRDGGKRYEDTVPPARTPDAYRGRENGDSESI